MEEETASQAMDAVFMELGWCGKYQLLQLFQILLCIFPLAFNVLSVVFLSECKINTLSVTCNILLAVVYLCPFFSFNVRSLRQGCTK